MRWYRVTKKIHGRFYDYWQRTCRVGKTVKTENKYIGPSSKSLRAFEPPTLTRQRNPATAEQQALPITPTEGPSQYEQTVIEYRSLLSSMSPRPQQPISEERQEEYEEIAKQGRRAIALQRRRWKNNTGPDKAVIKRMKTQIRFLGACPPGTGL